MQKYVVCDVSHTTYFTQLWKNVKRFSAASTGFSPGAFFSRALLWQKGRIGFAGQRRAGGRYQPFTASNSAQISSEGQGVQRLTTTITSAENTKAGSSS